jgi:hypothetical protein
MKTLAGGLFGRLTFKGSRSHPQGKRGNGDYNHAALPVCHVAGSRCVPKSSSANFPIGTLVPAGPKVYKTNLPIL